jgi:photosystem II stability/assembly factor-like uncharacterized protein
MIAGSLGAGVSLMPRSGRAGGFNALDPLSAPSIPVRDPKGVFLVAVASAGNRVVAVGEEGVIIYSDDNGQSWTQAEVPVSVNLTCVRFATPLQGWAAGHFGVILGTTDGGKTWQTLLNGLQVNQLTLQAAQAATAQPAADSSNAPPGLAFAMRRANAFVAQGPSIPFLSILLLGPNKLIVFGAYRMAMLTTDGGKTWVDWSLHIYDRLSHNIYDAERIGNNIYLVSEAGLVFCSTDDANSFLPTAPAGDVTLFGVMGKNEQLITTFGVAAACYYSPDGCKTWNSITLPIQDNLAAGCILSTGEMVIFTETGSVLGSGDGMNFQLVPNLLLPPVFGALEVQNGQLVVVGGAGASTIPVDQLKI